MLNSKKVVDGLKKEGKIHQKLIKRVRILTIISILLMGVTVYEIVRYGISIPISIGIAAVAFLLGMFVFTRMSKIVWDQESQMISAGKIDMLGGGIIVLYIAFEIGLRTVVENQFGAMAGSSGYLLMGIGASLLGRAAGTLWHINTFATQKEIDDNKQSVEHKSL